MVVGRGRINRCQQTLAALLIAMAAAAHVEADAPMRRVTVGIAQLTLVDADTWASARAEIDRIFRRARIELTWVPAEQGVNDAHTILILTNGMPSATRAAADSLGIARPHSHSAPAVALAFVTRIVGVARELKQSVATILAHVAAHELGHVLLNTTEHSAHGLMRGRWDHESLLTAAQGRLLFTDQESHAMRNYLSNTAGTDKSH